MFIFAYNGKHNASYGINKPKLSNLKPYHWYKTNYKLKTDTVISVMHCYILGFLSINKMTTETLIRANGIQRTIDKLEVEQSKISKFYSKKDPLTKEELEELMQIAMVNTSYAINRFKEELKSL